MTCVDASEFALGQIGRKEVNTICGDAFEVLKELHAKEKKYGVVIIDPPAFIKKRKDIENGVNAYLRIHRSALKVLKPGGILLTTSCSLHFSCEMMHDVLIRALYQEQRTGVIVEQLHQGQDHPVHSCIPETNYLKGFILSC
ncbi:MAG: hypothetical protein ACD_46C00214G0001 [uncultured bacterium]|nr:MAG: hypothetical protein ACD_46C00214G0001 [uncultured bacterium]